MEAALTKLRGGGCRRYAETGSEGVETIEWMRTRRAWHRARGRLYHLDPRSTTVSSRSSGAGNVLTEDSSSTRAPERPLCASSTSGPTTALYEAAARVGDEPDLDESSLTPFSFGCGVDATIADQVQRSEGCGDVHTVLKIDVRFQPGWCRKIRLRSSTAITERRHPRLDNRRGRGRRTGRRTGPASVVDSVSGSVTATSARPLRDAACEEAGRATLPRTEEMREPDTRSLAPQTSPIHFRFLTPLFPQPRASGRCACRARAAPPWRSASRRQQRLCLAIVVTASLDDSFRAR